MDTTKDQIVVIIDDEDEIRTLMELALAKPGRTVVSYADPSAALAYLGEDRPVDLIISDVRMAGMDGYSFIRRLQERRGGNAATPVIFVSANDSADNRMTAAGAEVEFIRKPFEIADLRARVDAAVARRDAPALGFDALLAGAVERAGKSERPMSLLLVATVPPVGALSEQRSRSVAASVAGVVRSHLRRSDEAAALAPYAYAATLDGCPPARAREIALTIAADLHTQADALGVDAHVGLACVNDCRDVTATALFGAAKNAVEEAEAHADRFAMREIGS